MDNINCDSKCNPQIESIETNKEVVGQVDTAAQCFPDRRERRCCRNDVLGDQSSLLFFFLILVCIICQSDCDISMETLLWFFLLLVVLFNKNYY